MEKWIDIIQLILGFSGLLGIGIVIFKMGKQAANIENMNLDIADLQSDMINGINRLESGLSKLSSEMNERLNKIDERFNLEFV